MKVQLLINFEYSMKDKTYDDLFGSFMKYCSQNVFTYQVIPKVGEYIDIEDIMWDWSKKFHIENDQFQDLLRRLKTEVSVRSISHFRDYTELSCTDMCPISE